MATAWFSITIFGYFRISGRFEKDSLQIFNRGTTGGIYWFKNGWNSNAILAWLFGTLVGFLGVSTTDFQGPISKILHEIDLSIPLSAMGALLLFIALEKFNPKVL
jgi:hypothetical protein